MYTYHCFISCSRWLLLVGTLWYPTDLLAQSGLVPAEAGKRTDTVRMGMGVFGNVLGIHGDDTLALQGDLILMEAEVVGEGTLSLCGSHPQHITARKSSVQNLYVANPTKVIVQGDLKIKKSLVIEKGVFDSRTAKLTLSDTCHLRVVKGGQIVWQENQLLVKQAKTIPQSRPASSTTWAAMFEDLTCWGTGRSYALALFKQESFRCLQKRAIPFVPPPEPGSRAAFIGKV